jgi:hypothetical protein
MAKQFKTTIAPPALSTDPTGTYAGEIYYNTVSGALKIFNGTTWSLLTGSSEGGTGTSNSFEVLATPPATPAQGRTYFDSSENTIKVFNGTIWYDVAGPKELLDHQHYAGEGFVRHVDYGNYVEYGNYIVSMDGGTASSNYSSAPNDDIIDGGNANG